MKQVTCSIRCCQVQMCRYHCHNDLGLMLERRTVKEFGFLGCSEFGFGDRTRCSESLEFGLRFSQTFRTFNFRLHPQLGSPGLTVCIVYIPNKTRIARFGRILSSVLRALLYYVIYIIELGRSLCSHPQLELRITRMACFIHSSSLWVS